MKDTLLYLGIGLTLMSCGGGEDEVPFNEEQELVFKEIDAAVDPDAPVFVSSLVVRDRQFKKDIGTITVFEKSAEIVSLEDQYTGEPPFKLTRVAAGGVVTWSNESGIDEVRFTEVDNQLVVENNDNVGQWAMVLNSDPLKNSMLQDDGEFVWEWKAQRVTADSLVVKEDQTFYGAIKQKPEADSVLFYNIISVPEYVVFYPKLNPFCFHYCVGSDLSIKSKLALTAEMLIRQEKDIK